MTLRKRLRSRGAILAAVAGVVAVSAGLGAGLGIIAQTAVADGAGAIIAAARGDAAVVRVAIRWAGQAAGSDAEAAAAAADQDAAVRETLGTLMPRAGLVPGASIRSEPLEVGAGAGAAAEPATAPGVAEAAQLAADLVLLSDGALLDRVTVIEGAWPATIDEAALAVGAADALGLRVGDRLILPGADERVTVTVSAIWQPLDSGDPAWAGDALIDRGVDGSTAGPLVIDERVWRTLDTRPIAQWVAPLDPGRATPDALAELASGLPLLAAVLDDDPRSQGTGIVVDGGLAGTVAEVREAAAGVEAIIPTVLALIAGASLTTLLELQRLLATVRRDETTLLRSRGASPRRLAGAAAGEALIVALPSAAVGGTLGTVTALALRPGSGERLIVDGATLLLASAAWVAAVAVVTVLIALVITVRSSRTALRRDTLTDSGRATRALSATALVLSLIAAAIAVGQFVLYRGPVVPTADGGSSVDPVAAHAPVLVMLAGALIAVLVGEPLARLAARAASRRDQLGPVLVTRPLARSAVLVTAPVLLIALAVSGLVVAAAVDTTTRASGAAARELALGAPLTVGAGPLDGAAEAALASGALTLGGEPWSAVPVAVTAGTIADAPATLVALDAATAPAIVATAGGAVEPERLAAAIAPESLPGLEVPASTVRIRLADDGVWADFWVADARGGVARIASGADGSAALPGSGGPWRVLALDVRPEVTGADSTSPALDVVLTGIVATAADGAQTRIAFEQVWQARPEVIGRFGGEVRPRSDGRSGFIATVVRDEPGAVRVMPDPAPLRFAITAVAAERVGAVVGDTVTVVVPGTSRRVEGDVADIVRAVPGAPTAAAVAVDLAASVQRQLAESADPPTVSAFWLAPDDPGLRDPEAILSAAAALSEIAPRGTLVVAAVESETGALAEGARTALWAAAAGALLLAIATVVIVTRAVGGARAVDVVVLRAVGVGARQQARARALEFASVLGFAVLAGVATGTAASVILVPDLARALLVDAPSALALRTAIDPAVALGLLIVLVLAVVLLAIDAGRLAARQIATLSAREVLR